MGRERLDHFDAAGNYPHSINSTVTPHQKCGRALPPRRNTVWVRPASSRCRMLGLVAILPSGAGIVPSSGESLIKMILRNVDADEARRNSEKFHDPSFRMRARFAAQATVRVRGGTDGRGTLLFLRLTHPGGLRAPVHR
jgi:hypothetical protein